MLNWEWYQNANVTRLFIHCLLKANWKEGKFQGKVISRGSFVTSLESLSKELGLSVQQIRTSLKHLISTKEITNESLTQYRVITVVNYELYQQNNKEDNKQLTNNQQTDNNQITTIVDDIDDIDDIDSIGTTTNTCMARKTIYDVIQEEYGRMLSPMEYEIVNNWFDMQLSEELILHAIKESVSNEAKSLRYVQRILETYKSKGIKTVSEAQKIEEEFRKKKNPMKKKETSKKYSWEDEFLNNVQ